MALPSRCFQVPDVYMCVFHWQAVLDAYSAARRPRCKAVREANGHAGTAFDHHGPHGTTPEGLVEDFQNMWDPVWKHDLDAEFDAAVATL